MARRAASKTTPAPSPPTTAKPKRRRRARKAKLDVAPPPKTIVDLGAPPTDPLAAEAWLHRALMLSLHDAATDPKLSAAQRRKEMRTISAAAAKAMPRARLYEAEQLIKRDRKELEEAKARRGAKLEARPPRPAVPTGAA